MSTRRTQPERSAATREALIDATIDSLAERGYGRSSVFEISERAGLSRGAHLHHFQTRSKLFSAAVEELAGRGTADFKHGISLLPDGSQRPGAALDMIWRLYNGPLFLVVIELSVQARTDAELRPRLEPLELMVRDRDLLRTAFAGDPEDGRLDEVAALAVASIRGLVVMRLLEPRHRTDAQWASCRALLLELFAQHAVA